MTDQLLDGWRARIRDTGGRIFGAGVLVTPDLVVTCAHVVAHALQASPNGARPRSPVIVDFPTATHLGACAATVVEDGWLAMADDYIGDIALLRLDRASPLPRASFATCGVPWRRSVRVFGHPRNNADVGVWATADMTGTAGPRGEWVQINSQPTGPRIVGGFSGAGVLDETGAVIGLLIGSDNDATSRGAWMVTVEAMMRLLPAFRNAVGELSTSAPNLPRHHGGPAATDPRRFRDELQIVETLLTLEGIGSRSRRDELARHLERVLGRGLGTDRDDRPRSDLLNMVIACLDQPDPGGFEALADACALLYGDTPASRSLRRLAVHDPGRRLTSHDIARLEALLTNLPAEAVAMASRVAFGVMGQRRDLNPADLSELVRALSQLTGRVGEPPPLLVFLDQLAERSDGLDRDALRQWVAHFAQRWELSPDELVFPGPVAIASPTHSSLVVTLQEDGPEANAYLLSISLDHDNGETTPLSVEDQPLTLDEVPGHLGLHLRRVTGQSLGPVGTLTIEFILPYELLSHPVDQWRVSGRSTLPLGAQYSVVVRSLDRLQSTIYHHRWAARWRSLRLHGHASHAQAVGFVQPTGNSPQSLRSAMNNLPGGFTDDFPFCLVLALPMSRRTGEAERVSVLRQAIEIGIPVLIWCRLPKASSQFIADMANHLHNRPVREVPEVVQRLRQDATVRSQPADHLGQHICLLWDGYDRLVPSLALRAPGEGGP